MSEAEGNPWCALADANVKIEQLRENLAAAQALLREACEHRAEDTGIIIVRCDWFAEATRAAGDGK